MLVFEEAKKRIVEELAGRLFTNYYTGAEYFPSSLTVDDVSIPLLAPEEELEMVYAEAIRRLRRRRRLLEGAGERYVYSYIA